MVGEAVEQERKTRLLILELDCVFHLIFQPSVPGEQNKHRYQVPNSSFPSMSLIHLLLRARTTSRILPHLEAGRMSKSILQYLLPLYSPSSPLFYVYARTTSRKYPLCPLQPKEMNPCDGVIHSPHRSSVLLKISR